MRTLFSGCIIQYLFSGKLIQPFPKEWEKILNSSGILGYNIIARIYFWNPELDKFYVRRIPLIARRNSFVNARTSSVDAIFMDVMILLYKIIKEFVKHLEIFRIFRYLALYLLSLSLRTWFAYKLDKSKIIAKIKEPLKWIDEFSEISQSEIQKV
jgi:hypothetical protein